jgi:hypothetical protein
LDESDIRAKAQSAFQRMRAAAASRDELSLEEINAEINEVRSKR